MLAEQVARTLECHAAELNPPPLPSLGEESQDEARGAPGSKKIKGKGKAESRKAAAVSATEGGQGEAGTVEFYRKQRYAKEDADIQGVSKMKMDDLAKSVASSRTAKIEEKILSSVLESRGVLATDLGSLLLLQNNQTVSHIIQFFLRRKVRNAHPSFLPNACRCFWRRLLLR